jgi:hypothetical protein
VETVNSVMKRNLGDHLRARSPTALAFTMPNRDKVIDMFRADLATARTAWVAAVGTQQERTEGQGDTFLAYRDGAGRYADFHALRHSFISNLVSGGVHPKTAQRLARHSTITLTMDRYTHLRRDDLADAVTALPDLSGPARQAAVTGTYGACDDSSEGKNRLSPDLSRKGEFPRSGVKLGEVKDLAREGGESLNRNALERGFTEGNNSLSALGLEPRTYGLKVRCSTN